MIRIITNLNKYSCVARKGPRKYYDIRLEDLNDDKTYFENFDPNFAQTQVEFEESLKAQALRNYTFAPVVESLSSGNSIELFKSVYTVGKHIQISYLPGEQAWVVASQHASIFVRNHEDLQVYESQSKFAHFAAYNVAAYWLDFFENSIQDKEGFLNGISGRTMCGTYIDNSKFNEILKYAEPTLLFHTIVQNDAEYQNCILPVHCYEFFELHNIPVAPIESVGEYKDFSSLLQALATVHEDTSNATLKASHRGCVVYLVEKGNQSTQLLTMGKIQSKEYQILTLLAKTLTDFWTPNEKITGWSRAHQAEYNMAYDNFLYSLEYFAVSNADHYRAIAEYAFNALKQDLELYSTFKASLCDFYIHIFKGLGLNSDDFVVTKDDSNNVVNDNHSPGNEETKDTFEDEEITVPTEDGIDRLLKNERIRKTSNIQKEEDTKPSPKKEKAKPKQKTKIEKKKTEEKPAVAEPTQLDMNLEDIIGSIKDEPAKVKKGTKKAKIAKGTKSGKTPKGKAPLRSQTSNEPTSAEKKLAKGSPAQSGKVMKSSPKKSNTFQQISKPSQTSGAARRASHSIEDLKVDEVDEDPVITVLTYAPFTSPPNIFKFPKLPLSPLLYGLADGHQPEDAFVSSTLYPLDQEISYYGIHLSTQAHPNMHVIPHSYTKNSNKHRIFSDYCPFGLKQHLNTVTFKNKKSGKEADFECIIYHKQLTGDLTLDCFTPYALPELFRGRRAQVVIKNVQYWYGLFWIYTSMFQNMYQCYLNALTNTVHGSTKHLYSLGMGYHVFNEVSFLGLQWVTSRYATSLATTKDFRQNVIDSVALKDKKMANFVQGLDSFIAQAPEEFWFVAYTRPKVHEYIDRKPRFEEKKHAKASPPKKPTKVTKVTKSKKAKGKGKKRVVIPEKSEDDFCALFQQNEEELQKSLAEERKQRSAKLAMVTSVRPPTEGQAGPKKSKKDIEAEKKQKQQEKAKEDKKKQQEKEKKEQEKKERELKKKQEQDRKNKERKDKELKEKQEQERKEQERKVKLEQERKEKERKDKLEQERKEKEKERKRKQEQERKEKESKEKLEQEQKEKERKEKQEQERIDRERKEKQEHERKEKERQEKREQERKEKERKDRLERERKEQLELEKKEKERQDKLEKERKEKERQEKERVEKERVEKEQKEKERIEQERREKLKIEQQEKKRKEDKLKEKKKLDKEKKEKAKADAKKKKEEKAAQKRLKDEALLAKETEQVNNIEFQTTDNHSNLGHQTASAKPTHDLSHPKISSSTHSDHTHNIPSQLKSVSKAKGDEGVEECPNSIKQAQQDEAKAIQDSVENEKKEEQDRVDQEQTKKEPTEQTKDNEEDSKKLAEMEEHAKEDHDNINKQIKAKKIAGDIHKLSEMEEHAKEDHDTINKQIKAKKIAGDIRKLSEIEEHAKEDHDTINKQIKAKKIAGDIHKLSEMEEHAKEDHDTINKQIKAKKIAGDIHKLSEMEEHAKEGHDTISKQIKAKKIAGDIHKLSEMEEHAKEDHDTINKQIKAKKIAGDIHKLSEMEEHAKEDHDSINKQIKAKKIAGDINKLSDMQEQQKTNITALNHEIKVKKDEDDEVKLTEIQQQHLKDIDSVNEEIRSKASIPKAVLNTTPTKTITLTDDNSEIIINPSSTVSGEKSPMSQSSNSAFGGSIRRSRGERLKNKSLKSGDKVAHKVEEAKRISKQSPTKTGSKTTRKPVEGVKVVKPSVPVKQVKVKTDRKNNDLEIEETKEPKYVPSGRKPGYNLPSARGKSSLNKSITKSTVNIKDIHYLGLTPSKEESEEMLQAQIRESLGKILDKHHCSYLEQLANAFQKGEMEGLGWSPAAPPLHITSALINGKATTKSKKSLEDFKIGLEENLNLNCLILVEDMFIAALCKPKLVEISSKIPYMAVWMNGAKPKDCSNILEHLLYKINPKMTDGEVKLRTYYSICDKSIFKDDIIGEINANFDSCKGKRVWYIFIKDSIKVDFVTFIKKLSG